MRHSSDEFVKKSRLLNYRARSAFKLIEILEKFPAIKGELLKPNQRVVDLGAAPGSWTQVVSRNSNDDCQILAIDLLPIPPIDKAVTLNIDFRNFYSNSDSIATLASFDSFKKVDLIMSDMCTNMSGNSCVDLSNNQDLWEQALNFASCSLKAKGNFIIKLFQSPESREFERKAQNTFVKIKRFRPSASRSESSEYFLICQNRVNALNSRDDL